MFDLAGDMFNQLPEKIEFTFVAEGALSLEVFRR